MSFFADNYGHLSFPIAVAPSVSGFRDAQRGALFAIGSHFTGRRDPAIVTMPTGSGKTAVLQATALLLRADRVLVVTPSRLVREQIADDFKTLGVLRRLGAVDADRYGAPSSVSIQAYLARTLDVPANDIVYWDHGSGETADFVTISRRSDGGVDVSLYHCKGSGGDKPGNRVDDVYEVCGQAEKSAIWCDLPRLRSRLTDRFTRGIGVARFVKGDVIELETLSTKRPVRFEMVVVQPGVSQSNVEPKLAEVLGAAASHLIRAGHRELRVLGSA